MKKWLSFLLLFSGCGPAYAAQFPPGTQIEILNDWSGGLNTTSPPHKIPKNFSPNMMNVFTHRHLGQIEKRGGFTLLGSTNTLAKISFMFTFNKENGDKEFIVSDDSIVLTTKDFQTFVFISSALNATVHLNAAQVRNKVWFTNGINSVFTWDGTVKQLLDGSNGTPNVPKFRYLVYWQERVFGANTSVSGSLTQWSDVASTAGIAIAPDSFLAWPITNGLFVGQGDGTVVTSLFLYRGQLQIGKERSIYTRYGTNTSTYFDRQTVGQVGPSSNESVVPLDGTIYFKGYDGIYKYDGGNAERISDAIFPDIQAIMDSQNLIRQNSWDTQSEFSKGQFFGSTATPDGFVTNSEQHLLANTAEANPGGTFIQLNSTSIFDTGFSSLSAGTIAPPGFLGAPYRIRIWGRWNDGGGAISCAGAQMTLSVKNPKTGLSKSASAFTPNFSGNAPFFDRQDINFSPSGLSEPFWNPDEINLSSFTIRLVLSGAPNTCVIDVIPSTMPNKSTIDLYPSSYTQYMSEVSTLQSVSAWSTFDSIRNTNGGFITYFFRSSTSAVNITTQTWLSISPGSAINAPTINNYIQWASTIDNFTNGNLVKANIDNVTIDHVEGSASGDRPFATDWKNEYWLSVATETSGKFSKQYVKAWVTNPNPNAWMPQQGMNIRSFAKDGTTSLFGGSASTGSIFRLDYGTNDNGIAIDAFYDTPELVFKGALSGGYDGNWMQEQLQEYWIDANAENGNTLRIGTSLDGGAFTEQTFDLSGTTRYLNVNYRLAKYAKYFKWRFRNNDLDKGLGLNNFAIVYVPLATR